MSKNVFFLNLTGLNGERLTCPCVLYAVEYGNHLDYIYQRWSPRIRPWSQGHILKSLAMASKVKSLALASKPQVLEN